MPWLPAAVSADLVAVSAAALGALRLLAEVPVSVTAVWLDWPRWPPADVPLVLVTRLTGMEAGQLSGQARAHLPDGEWCFTASSVLCPGTPAVSPGRLAGPVPCPRSPAVP